MARPPKIEASTRLTLRLPESMRGRLDALLYAPSEQRVPQGAYQEFFMALLDDYFKRLAQATREANESKRLL